MDEDAGVREDETAALGGGAKQDGTHARRHAGDDRGHRRTEQLDRVVDRHAVGDGAPGGVDIESDRLARAHRLEVEELLHEVSGGFGVHLTPDEDLSLFEEFLLDDGGDPGLPGWFFGGVVVFVEAGRAGGNLTGLEIGKMHRVQVEESGGERKPAAEMNSLTLPRRGRVSCGLPR